MRKFRVKVNDNYYDVEIEEISAENGQTPAPAVGNTAVSAPAAPAAAAASGKRGEIEVKSPIQGRVVNIAKAVGDKVKRGDTVFVLEAMKMEYEIAASADGEIATIEVSKGTTVAEGTLLFTIKG